MSTLETNSIGKYNGNNVSIDDALKLKSYTTTQRDALTSVAGDSIYNSTTSKVEYYDGSSWQQTGDPKVEISYLIIAGGGSGGSAAANTSGGGGGGAGGYINSYASETSGGNSSTATKLYLTKSTNYAVSIGGGGAGGTTNTSRGTTGSDSYVASVRAYGGGAAGTVSNSKAHKGGSGGGDGAYTNLGNIVVSGGGLDGQGFRGGITTTQSSPYPASGGGGAGAVGTDASYPNATAVGGVGLASSITGSAVTRAGGGGGSIYTNGSGAAGGSGGGGTGGRGNLAATAGTANTGGGGGGSTNANASGAGGSGVIILRYANSFTISQSGLTLSTATSGSDKITTITAGTGTVSFA